MVEGMMGPYRVVDLSYPVRQNDPRLDRLEKVYQASTRDYHTKIAFDSHLGTHLEAPAHWIDDRRDVGELYPENCMGRGVLLRLSTEKEQFITTSDLIRANEGTEGLDYREEYMLRPGDTAVLDSQFHQKPFTNKLSDPRPQLGEEAARWLAMMRVKCVAFGDGVAIENNVEQSCMVHEVLMRRGIMLLECLTNLQALQSRVFLLLYLPMPVYGLDACCVRATAIEGVPGFC